MSFVVPVFIYLQQSVIEYLYNMYIGVPKLYLVYSLSYFVLILKHKNRKCSIILKTLTKLKSIYNYNLILL